MKTSINQSQSKKIINQINQTIKTNTNQPVKPITNITIIINPLTQSTMKPTINSTTSEKIINTISLIRITVKKTWESFQQFLANIYSKTKINGKFLSLESYKSYGRKIAQTLSITEDQFLNASLQQLKIWAIQIKDKPLYRTYGKKFRSDLSSGFKAFIMYCRFLLGLVSF